MIISIEHFEYKTEKVLNYYVYPYQKHTMYHLPSRWYASGPTYMSNHFNIHLGIIVEIKSPTICFTVWMIPVIFFTTPVAKEGIKASVCGKVFWFEETEMPLRDKNNHKT